MNILEQLNQNIELLTKLSVEKRKSLINWFNKQNIEIQLLIFNEQKNQFFKLKSQAEHHSLIPLASFYLAINLHVEQEKQFDKKNASHSLQNLSKLTSFEIKKNKTMRAKEKREKLLNLISILKTLRAEKYSLRGISRYLRSKHRFDVSHAYIADFLKEFDL